MNGRGEQTESERGDGEEVREREVGVKGVEERAC